MRPEQRVAGAGVMHYLSQTKWSLRDIVALMLGTSDNTAANILLDHFGRKKVSDWLTDNFPGLQLQRNFIAPVVAGKDNFFNGSSAFACLARVIWRE